MEAMTGWDSLNLREIVTEEGQSRIDWAQFMLNMEGTKDIKILAASKDKIASELIKLRSENQKLNSLLQRAELKAPVSQRKIGTV